MAKNYEALPVIEQVPAHHMLSSQSRAVIETLTEHSLEAREAIMDAVEQFWVYSATWGLGLWEQLLDIETDPALELDARRAVIVAKMRGSGTCTASMLNSVVEAVTGYEAVMVEHPAEYTFSLTFVGDRPGFVDVDHQAIIDAVELIKPAHLKFVIAGITWRDLHTMQYTWARMHEEQLTWADLHTKVMIQQRLAV